MGKVHLANRLRLDTRKKKIYFIIRIAVFTIMAVYFLLNPSWYTKVAASTGIRYFYKKRLVFYPVMAVLMIFLPCFQLRQPGRKLHYILYIPLIAGSLLLAFATGEYIMKFDFRTMKPYLIGINLILLFAIFAVFFVFTNKVKMSLLITYTILVIFALVNYYVYRFRGEPINAADLYVAGTALNVAKDYDFSLTYHMFAGIFIWYCYRCFELWLPDDISPFHGKKRVIGAVPVLAAVAGVFYLFALSDIPVQWNVKVKVFSPYKCYHINGEALNFTRSFYYMHVDKPEGYAADTVKEEMENSGFVSDRADADDGQENPNVIVIMNEALTDFTSYSKVQLSEDPLEFIHSLKGRPNAVVGSLNVDVFGGRTANTEYEYLTGNTQAFLPTSYAVPYALYVRKPQPSVVWDMRDIGYSGCDAFHPYLANGYSRPRAYPNLGFKDFISIETIQDQVKDSDYLRNKLSDEADYRFVEQFYEQAKKEDPDKPFFQFNVTIQNHSSYSADWDNFEQEISVSGKFAKDADFKRYVNLEKYSDEAFEELTEYFEKVDEPTVIVMFGDHRPHLYNAFYKKLYGVNASALDQASTFQHYQTPLVVWANYDFNKNGEYDSVFGDISINYLSAAVTQMAGLPQTGYQKFLNALREQVPVITLNAGYKDKNGKIYDLDDTRSPYYDQINEYHMFMYNNQFDRRHRVDEFFTLKTDDESMAAAQKKDRRD